MMKYKTFLTLFFCALTVVQFLPADAKTMYKTFPEKHEKVDIDKTSDLTQFVDTRQGTDSDYGLSYGNTYPTTEMPFAMHLWSPQTGLNGDGWKYTFKADSIRGFCQSHQCSPTDQYVVGSPLFNKVTLTMENGRQFVIEAHNNSADNVYIQSATLNGISLERNYITYSNITAGGHLVF